VIDPSKNVLDLVEAAIKRIDDMGDLRARLADAQIQRMEDLAKLRAEYSKDIRHLESDRLDKIRSVDVANAAATAAQLLSAVTTLATTQQATAETLRNQVAATASAVASQTERVINPIIERLSLLERATASTSGKSEGLSQGAAILLGGFAFISSLLGIAGVLYAVLKP
jgi:CO dehydrogenase/acetyl-CoA synthase gamma subunit (corrinoid Fe-S protein)